MDGKITRVSPEFFRKKKESRWNGIISTVGNFRLIYDENVCGIISTVGNGRHLSTLIFRRKCSQNDGKYLHLFFDEKSAFYTEKMSKWNYFKRTTKSTTIRLNSAV